MQRLPPATAANRSDPNTPAGSVFRLIRCAEPHRFPSPRVRAERNRSIGITLRLPGGSNANGRLETPTTGRSSSWVIGRSSSFFSAARRSASSSETAALGVGGGGENPGSAMYRGPHPRASAPAAFRAWRNGWRTSKQSSVPGSSVIPPGPRSPPCNRLLARPQIQARHLHRRPVTCEAICLQDVVGLLGDIRCAERPVR